MTSITKTQQGSTTGKGILLILIAVNILPFVDGTAKLLIADGYHVIQVLWARYFFSTIVTLILVYRYYGNVWNKARNKSHRPAIQFSRGLLHTFSTLMVFFAYKHMPLADAMAVLYVYPLVVVALSAILLGETTGWRRWSAVIIGFGGTLLIVRPGFEAINPGALFALAASIAFALYLILTRKSAGSMEPLIALSYQFIISAVVVSLFVPFFWITPDLKTWGLFLMIGVGSFVGHLLIIKACVHAPASALAPFTYVEVITAAAIGFVLFGDIPEALTWAGIFIISASGIYIAWRERAKSDHAE